MMIATKANRFLFCATLFLAVQAALNSSVANGSDLFGSMPQSQTQTAVSVPPDSPRWDLQGQAKVADYQGRKCLFLDGGGAVLKDFEMRDAVIDVDIATPAVRG